MGFGEVIVMLAVAAVLMLIFRALALWYWKVNELLTALQAIQRDTARVAMILGEVHSEAAIAAAKKAAALNAELDPAPGSIEAYQLGK